MVVMFEPDSDRVVIENHNMVTSIPYEQAAMEDHEPLVSAFNTAFQAPYERIPVPTRLAPHPPLDI